MSNSEFFRARFGKRRTASRSGKRVRFDISVSAAVARDIHIVRHMSGTSITSIITACVLAGLPSMMRELRGAVSDETWNEAMERFNASEKA